MEDIKHEHNHAKYEPKYWAKWHEDLTGLTDLAGTALCVNLIHPCRSNSLLSLLLGVVSTISNIPSFLLVRTFFSSSRRSFLPFFGFLFVREVRVGDAKPTSPYLHFYFSPEWVFSSLYWSVA